MGTGATPKQQQYIHTLMQQRVIPEDTLAGMKRLASRADFSVRDASTMIGTLQTFPWRPRNASPAAATQTVSFEEAYAALEKLDTSFFAIPAGYVSALGEIDLRGNDYLFVRTRNYRGRKYLSRVIGSVGTFRYGRFHSPRTVLALSRIIAGNSYDFQRAFHEQTGRCGRCAAELTDKDSRARGFGPECWRIMGH